jgi:ribosomal protein L11 methyltransferase
MSFQEVIMHLEREQVEPWSDAMLEHGALAVSAEDADADSLDEQAIYGEPGTTPEVNAWARTKVVVLIAEGEDPQQLLGAVALALDQPVPVVQMREVADADWVRLTQAQYEPIPVGRRLLITPSWREDGNQPERLRIIVDPGLAFGTGSHPTTHLCLQWLEEHILGGESIIDYGCGSGILAIAAKRLGAGPAVGIDIDPQALIASRSNAEINQVTLLVQSTTEPLPSPAPIVVANILASPLKLLAPLLISLVAPGGRLALSGVLERQIDEVCDSYKSHGMMMQAYAVRDGWACLAGVKA